MGWKEREARQALDAVRPHVGPDEPIEAVLRRCLAVLNRSSRDQLSGSMSTARPLRTASARSRAIASVSAASSSMVTGSR
jgi:hypothetical protein